MEPIRDWCDPALDPHAARRRMADAAAADRLARDLRLESGLRTILAAEGTARRRTRTRVGLGWATAAAALIAVGAWWVWTPDGRVPTLDGGPVAVGIPVTVADTARLEWSDGSRVVLDPGAQVVVPRPGDGHALRLIRGHLHAEVAHREAGSPFRIVTDEAVCRVLGTAFTMERTGPGTRLRVSEGRVRLETAATGWTAGPGGVGFAFPDGTILDAPPPGRLRWRASALAGADLGGDGHSPFGDAVATARAPTAATIAFGPEAKGDPLFRWDPSAELRFAYRTTGGVPWIGIWIRAPGPGTVNRYLSLGRPAEGRWALARLRLDAIPAKEPGRTPAPGNPVDHLHLQAGWAPGAVFEVAGLRVEDP